MLALMMFHYTSKSTYAFLRR